MATMVTTRRQAARQEDKGGASKRAASPRASKRTPSKARKTPAKKRSPSNVQQQPEYEFFGPSVGPLGIVVGLPAVMYGLYGFCGKHGCVSLFPFEYPEPQLPETLLSLEGFLVYFGWILAVVSISKRTRSPHPLPKRNLWPPITPLNSSHGPSVSLARRARSLSSRSQTAADSRAIFFRLFCTSACRPPSSPA